MHPISKALFFSLVVLIFAFSPVIGEQPKPDSNLKVTNVRERDLLRKKGIEPIPGLRDRYPSNFNGIEPFPHTEQFEHPLRRDLSYTNSTNPSLTSVEQRAMKAIIDDFLVNDDTSGGCSQYSPAIARDSSGNFVITWEDERYVNPDIYAQRYNSTGTPSGSNFKVNDDVGSAGQWSPAISMDGSGNFVITWEDERNDYYGDIYAQRYNSSGAPLGSNFKVNDDDGTANQRYPAIATDGSGNFIITWGDGRNYNSDIYAQRYDSSGTPIDSNFKVADDAGTSDQSNPAIAMNGSGNFVIAWIDNRNGNWDIYALIHNSSGNPMDTTFQVNDDTGTVSQIGLAIGMGGTGNFVITWIDVRNGMYNYDIYAKMYYSSGNPTDSNFQVNEVNGTANGLIPAIAMEGTGNFVITWVDMQNGWYWGIYAQMFDSLGNPMDSNFQVNDDTGTTFHYKPAIALDGSGNFLITWSDYRNGNYDIYAQRYNSSSTPQGTNFRTNDDAGTAQQVSPAIATDGSGKFVITWTDTRSGRQDIYAQRYNSTGTPLGYNFKVNDDAGTTDQSDPAIAVDGSGNFVVTWEDNRNEGKMDIYAQKYNSSGTPLGSNFKVNDDGSNQGPLRPAIGVDISGNFVITWDDYRNGNWDIYAQRYNSTGVPLGYNFKVNDDAGTAGHNYPAIAMDGSGNFVISWHDTRNLGNWDIYAQRYNSAGAPLGSNFKVNYTGTAEMQAPAIALDGSGNFVIAWVDYRNSYYVDIYAQKYNSSGVPLDSNFKVNDDAGDAVQWYPAIASDALGNFIIAWQDYRNATYPINPDIYAQRYNSSGSPVGSNFLVPNPLYASFAQQYPAVATSGAKIYYTWQDNRRAKGWDIYAKSMYFLRGNVNGDDKVSLSDIVYLINYLFKFGPEPIPELGIGDANCDGKVSLSDIVYLINYLFKFGPPPCP